jgi:hypothetical protein
VCVRQANEPEPLEPQDNLMHLSLAQPYTTRYIGVHAVTTNEPDEPKEPK